MNAFILAAGFGTRLRPLTNRVPKPLIPVLNVPAIRYSLALLGEAGIDRAVCNVHHHAEKIRKFLSDTDDVNMTLVVSEEPTILGTGGGLKQCEHLLGDDHFLLLNSDIVADFDLGALVEHHRRSGKAGTLVLFETPFAATIGDVGVKGENIVDFRNMLGSGYRSNFIYTGAALLDPSIFRHLSAGFSSIVDTGFTGLISEKSLGFFIHRGFWLDIGTPQSLWEANIISRHPLLDRFRAMDRIGGGAGPRMIAPDVAIGRGVRLENSVIGSGCRIADGAVLEQAVLLPGTVIEKNSVVSKTILFPGGELPPEGENP